MTATATHISADFLNICRSKKLFQYIFTVLYIFNNCEHLYYIFLTIVNTYCTLTLYILYPEYYTEDTEYYLVLHRFDIMVIFAPLNLQTIF